MRSPFSRCEAHIFLPKERRGNAILKYQRWFHVTHVHTCANTDLQTLSHNSEKENTKQIISFALIAVLLFHIFGLICVFFSHHEPTSSVAVTRDDVFLFISC